MRPLLLVAIVCVAVVARAEEPELEIPSVGIPQLAVFPAPSVAEAIPPPIVAAPLPPFGRWRTERLHRGELLSGLLIGTIAYTITAAVGVGTRDYWLLVPVAGPVIGSVYVPRGMPRPIDFGIYGLVPGVIDLALQGALAPLFTLLGYQQKKIWQPQ
jgi:hypothetical protein